MAKSNTPNKTVLITGASGNGIGRSIALTLARENYNIIINYKHNKNPPKKL